ncbi:hypothetical protein ACFW7J_11485 [Streptomyces sp. NPDC059525]|uniref:hypothetical protein n=1 Tax=Streptomyces sp. NPDC059525 TaxID=3346857 RepID=UPI0036ACF0BA
MEDSEAQRRLLRYGCDITLGDVTRLESFLMARTARLAQAERGTDERQMARAVRTTLHHLVVTLQHCLSFSDGGSEAQPLVRLQVDVSWNALWALVSPWRWHEEYDQERWRSVKYWNESQKEEFEERLANEFSRNRRRSASEGGGQ